MANLILLGIGGIGAIGGLVGASLFIDHQKKHNSNFDPSSILSVGLIGRMVGVIVAYTIVGCIIVNTGLCFGLTGIYYGTKKLLLLSGIL